MLMSKRTPGYYWVDWTDDIVVSGCRRPGPLVGEWDGKAWWFPRTETYRFDCEVKVLSESLTYTESLEFLPARKSA
jgi:hypothetical protein